MIDPFQAPSLGNNLPSYKVPCGWCYKCLEGVESPGLPGFEITSTILVVCAICGNKRCPHAMNCASACTNSNAPGQPYIIWESKKKLNLRSKPE